MNPPRDTPRPIAAGEAEVIRACLRLARTQPSAPAAEEAIDQLVVVGRCGCGCAGVDFDHQTTEERPQPLGDAVGTTPRGGSVGVIVWGTFNSITGLEIYDLGAGDGDLCLPRVDSVQPWAAP